MEWPSAPVHPRSNKLGQRTRVLVIDDHPVVCEALASALDREDDLACCGIAFSAREAVERAGTCNPQVLVVDMSLGDAHGLSLVHTLRSLAPTAAIVVYSMSAESAFAERAIRAGALGYVPKGESTRSVLDAIRMVRDGRIFLSPGIASRVLSRMVRQSPGTPRADIERLTNQELAVFQMLGQAHSVSEIASRLGVNPKTVVTYQRRVMGKLGLGTTGKLVRHALQWAQGVPLDA